MYFLYARTLRIPSRWRHADRFANPLQICCTFAALARTLSLRLRTAHAMKRQRVKDEPPSDEGDEEEPVSSDSGLPDREALPQHHAVHAAPDARLASGVVSIEDVLPKRAAVQPRLREGTPPVEDLFVDTVGQSVEMLRLLRQPRYFDEDFEAVRGHGAPRCPAFRRAAAPCFAL